MIRFLEIFEMFFLKEKIQFSTLKLTQNPNYSNILSNFQSCENSCNKKSSQPSIAHINQHFYKKNSK